MTTETTQTDTAAEQIEQLQTEIRDLTALREQAESDLAGAVAETDQADAKVAELIGADSFDPQAATAARNRAEKVRQRREVLSARVDALRAREQRLWDDRNARIEDDRREQFKLDLDAYERELTAVQSEFLEAIREAHASIPTELRAKVANWNWLWGAAAYKTGYIPKMAELGQRYAGLIEGAAELRRNLTAAAPYGDGVIGLMVSSGELAV